MFFFPLHIVWLTQRKVPAVCLIHTVVSWHHTEVIGVGMTVVEKSVKTARTVHVILQFLPVVLNQHSVDTVAGSFSSVYAVMWNNNCTLQHDHYRDDQNSARCTFKMHMCIAEFWLPVWGLCRSVEQLMWATDSRPESCWHVVWVVTALNYSSVPMLHKLSWR